MAGLSSEFVRSYNSFSGCDIRAVFGNKVIGTLQGISWSVTREKAPVYTMGDPDPRAYARGKRGIAGSLVFVQFDGHALLEYMQDALFWSDIDSLRPDKGDATKLRAGAGSNRTPESTVFFQETDNDPLNPWADQEAATPWFSDQIPPFDITLTAVNEYGAAAIMRLYGIEILNEGSGASIDDIVLEQQATFVCRTISPWRPLGYKDPRTNGVALRRPSGSQV